MVISCLRGDQNTRLKFTVVDMSAFVVTDRPIADQYTVAIEKVSGGSLTEKQSAAAACHGFYIL